MWGRPPFLTFFIWIKSCPQTIHWIVSALPLIRLTHLSYIEFLYILDLFMASFFCFISYFSISVSIIYLKKLLYLARPTPQINFSLIVSWLFLPFCCKDYFMFIYPLWGSEGLSILGECFSLILENFLPLFLWILPFAIFLTFLPVLLIRLLFLHCHSC